MFTYAKSGSFCRYSPAILLLWHFDVFRNLANEGSQSDHTGIISEAASVIRKFTQPVLMDEEIFLDERLNGGPVSNRSPFSSFGEAFCLLYYILVDLESKLSRATSSSARGTWNHCPEPLAF